VITLVRFTLAAICLLLAITLLWRARNSVRFVYFGAIAFGLTASLAIYYLLATGDFIVSVRLDLVYDAMVIATTIASGGRLERLAPPDHQSIPRSSEPNDDSRMRRNVAGFAMVIVYFVLHLLIFGAAWQ
jgi:uncharacterized membrane protein